MNQIKIRQDQSTSSDLAARTRAVMASIATYADFTAAAVTCKCKTLLNGHEAGCGYAMQRRAQHAVEAPWRLGAAERAASEPIWKSPPNWKLVSQCHDEMLYSITGAPGEGMKLLKEGLEETMNTMKLLAEEEAKVLYREVSKRVPYMVTRDTW